MRQLSILGSLPVAIPLFLMSVDAGAEDSGTATIVAEATIFEDQAGSNGGRYDRICAGNLDTAFMTRRGLIQFELPDIPDGATVTRVELAMGQNRVRRNGGPKMATVELRRITSSWMEGEGGSTSQACGGGSDVMGVDWNGAPDVLPAISAAEMLPTTDNFSFSFNSDTGDDDSGLVDDVQAWIDGTANFGWMLTVEDEDEANNARLIDIGTLTVAWDSEPDDTNDFKINPGLNDAWYNAETAGSGVFFTVLPDAGIFFLSWFTYDTERPEEGATANFGEPGHRWITAQGPYDGNVAILSATLTSGGIFNSPEPSPENQPDYGGVVVQFEDCNSAVMSFDFPGPGETGDLQLTRVVPDNVPLCEALNTDASTR